MRFNKAQDLESCIVKIFSDNDLVVGTGFSVGDGYILTCQHIVTDILSLQDHINIVSFSNFEKIIIGKVHSTSDDLDIAIIKINENLQPLPLSDISDYQTGERAWTCGCQLIKRLVDKAYLADVMISSMDAKGMFLLEASLLPGMSGAPVFNLSSRKVIGVVTSRVTKDDNTLVINTALALPVEKIINLWPWLREINARSTLIYQIDKINNFKMEISAVLEDDFSASVEKDQVIDGQVIDLIASYKGIGRSFRTAVFCFPEVISREAVSEFGSLIITLRNQNKVDNGLIVTNQFITDEIRKLSSSYPIDCKSIRDLEDESLGLSNYIDKIIDDYENISAQTDRRSQLIPELSKLNSRQFYVDLDAIDQREVPYRPIDVFFSSWLEQDFSNIVSLVSSDSKISYDRQVSVLGNSGVGKTSFCLHLTYYIARLWRDKKSSRVPLFIPLKGYNSLRGLDDAINSALKKYKIRSDASQLLRHTTESGKFLLIFDGFDEMGTSVDNADIQKRFDEIVKFADKRGKVVLTCRSNFFQFEADEKRTLSPFDVASQLLIQSQKQKAHILYLEPFNEPKILEFLSRHPSIAGAHKEWWEKIKHISNMESLSHRPILLRMIVDAIPSIEIVSGEISASELYVAFIENLLQQDKQNKRTLILEPNERLIFLKALSLDLMSSPEKDFTWGDLPPKANLARIDLIEKKSRLDYIEYDLRNIPLLQRRGDKFSFIHDSFIEFLTAHNIADVLVSDFYLSETDISTYGSLLNEEVRKFIVGIIKLYEQKNIFQYINSTFNDNFVIIPKGPFISGGFDKGLEIKTISQSFMIAKNPVIWSEYELYRPGYRSEINITDAENNFPATYISWEDANSYCTWLSNMSGKKYRLPSQDEWQKAARGIDGRLYPWGDKPATHDKANYGFRFANAIPVGSFSEGKSPYGVMDMSGNIAELTSTSDDEGKSHLCCGGSWEDPASLIQCASQRRVMFNAISHDVGFRVVQEIEPEV